jgi:IS30 family transposase
MLVPDPGPVSPRFLTQDDRIAIADGLQAGTGVKQIAASIGKSMLMHSMAYSLLY